MTAMNDEILEACLGKPREPFPILAIEVYDDEIRYPCGRVVKRYGPPRRLLWDYEDGAKIVYR